MIRTEAIAIARKHINACHADTFPNFMSCEWVIAAIIEAADPNRPEIEPIPDQEDLPFWMQPDDTDVDA